MSLMFLIDYPLTEKERVIEKVINEERTKTRVMDREMNGGTNKVILSVIDRKRKREKGRERVNKEKKQRERERFTLF